MLFFNVLLGENHLKDRLFQGLKPGFLQNLILFFNRSGLNLQYFFNLLTMLCRFILFR